MGLLFEYHRVVYTSTKEIGIWKGVCFVLGLLMNFTINWHVESILDILLMLWLEILNILPICLLSIFSLWAVIRFYRSYHYSHFSPEFEIFTCTSFPAVIGQRVLRNSEVDVEFRRANLGQNFVIDSSYSVNSDMFFVGLVRQVVESGNRPILEITSAQFFLDLNLQGVKLKEDFIFTDGPLAGKMCFYPHIDKITFLGNESPVNWVPIVIRNARINSILIDESFRGELRFEDCWIGSLQVVAREVNCGVRLSVARTYLGGLNLGSNGCIEFSINSGGISQLVCPSVEMDSPVERAFSVDETAILHKSPKLLSDEEISNYRNLLSHIRNRSSPFTQQLISAAIFRLELPRDSGLHKFVNFCYGIFSAYNTKPSRPLLWMLVSFLISLYVAFSFDLAVYSKDCKDVLAVSSNWVSQLCEEGMAGKAFRSFALVINTIINPFSTFSDTAALRARTIYFNFFLLLVGLLNLVWATLTVFAVKTRFSGKSSN